MRTSKKLLSLFLSAVLCLSLLPTMALAESTGYEWDTLTFKRSDGTLLVENTDYTVSHKTYNTHNGAVPSYNEYTITTRDAVIISGGAENPNSSIASGVRKCTIAFASGADASITLHDVTCLGTLTAQTGYTMNVTLEGTNNVDSIIGSDGTTEQTSLVFGGEGTLNGKHIGGASPYGTGTTSADITINSGTYNLDVGSDRYAAIGGGYSGSESVKSYADGITINGGTITAKGGYGAAIGGGQYGDAKNITINGGTIVATGSFGAGIGSGMGQDDSSDASALNMAENITITGGDVTAVGGSGAAIGGGSYAGAKNITISGGTVNASVASQGAYAGAAIGGGAPWTPNYSYTEWVYPTTENITISGGTVTASAQGTTSYSKVYIGHAVGYGTFNNTGNNFKTQTPQNVTLSCGTYTGVKLDDSFCAPKCKWKQIDDSDRYEVVPVVAAKIGDTEYEDLATALAAVTKDAPLTLVADSVWAANKPAYYNGTFYDTLSAAITAANEANAADAALIYMRPGFEGAAGLVADHDNLKTSITIFGNDAKLNKGWEPCVEYTGTTYTTMQKDFTISIYNLHNGAGVWGIRTSDYTLNVNMENCRNVHEFMINSDKGSAKSVTNYTIKNCTFDKNNYGQNCPVTTTNPGTVTVENCTFTNMDGDYVFNINNKNGGTINVTASNLVFDNCGTAEKAALRLMGEAVGSAINATVSNVEFKNNTDKKDIVIGKANADGNKAVVTYDFRNFTGYNTFEVYTAGTADLIQNPPMKGNTAIPTVVNGSGDGGGSSTTKTETTTNADGSKTTTTTDTKTGAVTETTTKTETAANGTKTETKVETVTQKDGTVTEKQTETATAKNGTTATKVETTDAAGKTETKVEAKVTAAAVTEAKTADKPVTIPVTVESTKSTETAATVSVSVPKSAGSTKVEVPVTNVTAGTVAVLVKADGTEEIIKTSVLTEDGVALKVEGDVQIKIIDNTKEFTDVVDNHWAGDAIDFATSHEIFNGTGEKSFAPEATMTRAMLFTVLARFDDAPVVTTGENWYADSMEWAKTNGVSDGTNPEASISREQLATMLYRYAGAPAVTGDLAAFGDAATVSDYAAAAMQWAVSVGLINGIGGNLEPQGFATRAQLAAIMQRFCTNVAF